MVCKGCGKELAGVPGKVQPTFCSDKCRKALTRAELKKLEAVAAPSVDEPRTDGTNQPRTPTSDIPKRGYIGAVPETPNITRMNPERTAQGNIRVSKPGDADYVPMCETTRAFVEGRDKRPEGVTEFDNVEALLDDLHDTKPKRGKDIKCFGDLPMDVQASIDRLSVVDGKIDSNVLANRRAIAVNYLRQFPDKFHSVGVV